MEIRPYQTPDYDEIRILFQTTIYRIAASDYNERQLALWAASADDQERFGRTLAQNHAFVAVEAGQIVGFADMTEDGYIDRVYTHADWQGRGIATALLDHLVGLARTLGLASVYLESSQTARTFYEQYGFQNGGEVLRKKQDVTYVNYEMTYALSKN